MMDNKFLDELDMVGFYGERLPLAVYQLDDYILMMLGAPAIAVDLSKEELDFCIEKPIRLLQKNKLNGHVLDQKKLITMVRNGALALGRYIVAKKRFNRLVVVVNPTAQYTLFTPGEDGFAEMTRADAEWNEFVEEVGTYRRTLRKPPNVENDPKPAA